MKKITKSDIITHKKFIDSLIAKYSEYINNYDFDDLYKIINRTSWWNEIVIR